MLTQIHISNLITIEDIHLDILSGTTVLTGETGAGKSILIDAIELALGERATAEMVRTGHDKAEISICFDIHHLPEARAWLKNYDLDADECIIRRTISKDGRSRSFINGSPTTLQPLRELSELLMNIHGQHEHQTLLKSDKQRDMLDRFADHDQLIEKVKTHAHDWQHTQQTITELQKLSTERHSRGEFLKFQLRELEELHLQPNEFASLDAEHKQLAHAGELLENVNHALHFLADQEETNALHALHHAIQALATVQRVNPKIATWMESLNQALIHVHDTENELRHYLESVDLDPERLQWTEQRITTIFDLARKHKVDPHELIELQHALATEYAELEHSDERLNELTQQLQIIEKNYLTAATKLSQSREKYARKLEKEITSMIRELSLPHGEFHIQLEAENAGRFSLHGLEKIIFQIKTNTGQSMQPLAKVASGGELSRISLAIHMATAEQHTIPTLIFDEVDVGIGGGTAEIVGKLLRRLGNTHQVLCVTHLPQVAAQGHHHLRVEKIQQKNITHTHIHTLNAAEKIQEIARMLGGVEMTKKTLEHAKEMLENVN